MRPLAPWICVSLTAICLVVAGCESSGNGSGSGSESGPGNTYGSGSSGSGTGSGSSGSGSSAGEIRMGGRDEFGPAARSQMNAAWDAFKKESPEWPRLRTEWVKLGQRATNTLVENLFTAMVKFHVANFPRGYEACRSELLLLGNLALPTLTGILREPYYMDRKKGGRSTLPTGVIGDLADIMSYSSPASVGPLEGLLGSKEPAVRRAAAAALGKTKHPSALGPLVDMLDDGDWIDRIAAAKALGVLGNPGGAGPLVSALSDSEDQVVEAAAAGLARMRARSAISALDSRRARAQNEGKYSVAAACGSAAKSLRGGR